jgi:CheY-like chemotaxis protein
MSAILHPDPVQRRPLAGRRAMVVEGVLRTRATLRDAVAALGTQDIVLCESGAHVIEELERGSFDLVVVGQIYGDGYDATVLLERIRERRLLPLWGTLVAIAAERNARTVTGLAAHAPDACILKPFSTGQLRERLQQVVAYKQRLEPIMAAVDAGDCEAALSGCRLLEARAVDLKAAAYRRICERLIELRKPDRAQDVLIEAQRLGEAPWMTLALARVRTLQGDGAQAKQLLRKLVEEKPEFIASYDVLAAMEAATGEYGTAVKHLQEANARTGFSLRRMRRTGEYAARGGDLVTAEKVLDRVMSRVYGSELADGGDYVNMVEVLAARGKLQRAEQIAAELRRTQSDHPDSRVLAQLVDFHRAAREDGPAGAARALSQLLQVLEKAGPETSVEVRIQVLDACVGQGARQSALDVARGIALSGRADRLKLRRVRELLDQT